MLKGRNIQLRALEPTDAGVFYKWENNPQVWEVSGTLSPLSKHTIDRFIQESLHDLYVNKELRLVITDLKAGNPLGFIDLFEFDPRNRRAGIGILIAEEEQGKGVAWEALSILMNHCREVLGLHSLFANIAEGNKKSEGLFLKAGFKKSGTKKDWILSGKKWKKEFFYQKVFRNS